MAEQREHSSATVGVIGLGLVGTAVARRLASHGFTVVGYDVDAQARAAFTAGRALQSAAAVGRIANRVVLAVFDTPGAILAIEGPQGLLTEGTPHAIVDCSTGDPEALQALSRRLASIGIAFIEAPLSGSSQQIALGEATMLLGGDAAAIAENADLLQAIAQRSQHVGVAGMGARAKLATNLVLGLNRAALAEGMVFAQRLGIPRERFLELVLDSPARSDAAAVKGPAMVSEDFAPRSRIRQHLKDLRLMLTQAAAAGQGLPLTEAHARLLEAAVAFGDGDLDNAGIVRQLSRETPQDAG